MEPLISMDKFISKYIALSKNMVYNEINSEN